MELGLRFDRCPDTAGSVTHTKTKRITRTSLIFVFHYESVRQIGKQSYHGEFLNVFP